MVGSMGRCTGCPRCDQLPANVFCSACLDKKYGELEQRRKVQERVRRRALRLKPTTWDGTLMMVLICPKDHRWESVADFTATGDPFRTPICSDCGLFWNRYQRIVLGEVTDTACTEKCWKAKDDVCKCSCGGARHGIFRNAA